MPSAELWITFGVEIFVVVVLYQQVDKGKMAMSTAVFLGCASILIGILKGLTTECVVSPRTAIVFGVGGLAIGVAVLVVFSRLPKAATSLPDGPLTWKFVRKPVIIPDARESKSPQGWADGLGRWDEFIVHNFWAYRPTTKKDFSAWKSELDKTVGEIVGWMKTAQMPYLDVKNVE